MRKRASLIGALVPSFAASRTISPFRKSVSTVPCPRTRLCQVEPSGTPYKSFCGRITSFGGRTAIFSTATQRIPARARMSLPSSCTAAAIRLVSPPGTLVTAPTALARFFSSLPYFTGHDFRRNEDISNLLCVNSPRRIPPNVPITFRVTPDNQPSGRFAAAFHFTFANEDGAGFYHHAVNPGKIPKGNFLIAHPVLETKNRDIFNNSGQVVQGLIRILTFLTQRKTTSSGPNSI